MKKILLIGVVLATAALSGCYYYGPCLNGSGPVISELRDIEDFTGVTNTGSFDLYITQSDNFSVEVIAQENLVPIIETYVSGYTLIVRTENDACFKSSSPVEVHVSMPETDLLRLNGSGRVFADRVTSSEVEISNSGSGFMEIDSVLANTCVLSNSGSGHVDIEATYVDEAEIVQSGSGAIICDTLFDVTEVNIRHSSSGRVSAFIIDGAVVDASLSGSGRILLEGYIQVAEYLLNSSGSIDALDLEASDVEAINAGSGNIFLWATDLLDATITGSGDIVYYGDPLVSEHITGSGRVKSY